MSHRGEKNARVHVRLLLPNGGSLEEAHIELIEAVRQCRSISGAGKLVGFSYNKTRLMADALNRTYQSKVIETFPGLGAAVTVFGQRLVVLFRSIERCSATVAAAGIGELTASLDWSFEDREAGGGPVARQD